MYFFTNKVLDIKNLIFNYFVIHLHNKNCNIKSLMMQL